MSRGYLRDHWIAELWVDVPLVRPPPLSMLCCRPCHAAVGAQTYNGPELLAVGGETGLWLWQVAEWAHGREGKGTCCSTSLTCNKVRAAAHPAHVKASRARRRRHGASEHQAAT